jgi:Transcription elongation factor, N-terminal
VALLGPIAVVATTGMAATLAGIAASDCIHDAGELKFRPVGRMYQDHFRQADLSLLIFCACLSRFLSEMMGRISKVPEDVKKSARAQMTPRNVVAFHLSMGFIRICWAHSMESRWEDYEMRKGFTREPQRDEPATRGTSYITPSGLQRLRDEHQFLLTRERPAVVEVVTWAASNGDRSENADYQYGKRRASQVPTRSISTATTSVGCHF